MIPPTEAPNTFSIPTQGLPPSGGRRAAILLGRAVHRRCPYCGAAGIFRTWFELHKNCPSCGVEFNREEGYFLGAMAINLVVTEGVTVGIVTAVMVFATLDLLPLEVVAISLAVLLPTLFYPYSRMMWMALNLQLDPPEHQTDRRLRSHDLRP